MGSDVAKRRESGRRIVLVGAGHAHLQVVRAFAGRADVDATLINDGPTATYSGMLPGAVAGLYAPEEIAVDLEPLCRRAGVRFVDARVSRVDAERRRVEIADGDTIEFDAVSLNIGSVPSGLTTPGARDHAVPTRPIGAFLARLDRRDADLPEARAGAPRVVVVGGGAAGVELAFGLDARYRRAGRRPATSIVERHDEILEGRGERLVDVAHRALTDRGIELVTGAGVDRVEEGVLHLSNGRTRPFDLLVWATGAAAPPVLRESGFAVDRRGYLRVGATLQAYSPGVFGAGDCIVLDGHPTLARAGVYPVRQGPVLARNLLASLSRRSLESFVPQSGFLALLMTGDGRAILSWRALAWHGRWPWWLKDRIDRAWMRRFREGGRT